MEVWIFLSLIYGILGGVTDILKKKAVQKSSVIEVLSFYSLLSLIFVIPSISTIHIDPGSLLLIFIKSLVIFFGFFLSFRSIDHLPIGIYSIILLSKTIFSIFWGCLFLGESLSGIEFAGICVVILGLLLINFKQEKEKSNLKFKYILMVFGAAALISLSVLFDKIITKTITPIQLQFWYMLFLSGLYWFYKLIKGIKFKYKEVFRNLYIPILSLVFFLADRIHFIASAIPDSKVTVMTLLRQSSVFVSILFGSFIFHEKNIWRKILCSIIVLLGIFLIIFDN